MRGRRGNGEGTIYQLADGRWRGQATIAGQRRSVAGRTRKEAQAKLRQLLGDAERGILPPSAKITVTQHFARWLDDVARHSVRPHTMKNYRDLSRLYILPTLGQRKLGQLQPAEVQRLYSDLLDRGLAPKTVRNVHVALHRALGQAVTWNLAPRNVAALVAAPRLRRGDVVALNAEEVMRLRAATRGGRWEALITVALVSGVRIGDSWKPDQPWHIVGRKLPPSSQVWQLRQFAVGTSIAEGVSCQP